MPRKQKVLALAAVALVVGVALAGTATAAGHYVISRLSQISPSVMKQLQAPATTALTANGTAATVDTLTPVATLKLPTAPALVTGMVVLDNGAPLDVSAACVLRLGSTDVSVPAAVDIPATLPTNSADTTTTVALTAAVSTPGVLTLACTDNDGSGSVGATGTLSALTVGSAQVVGGTTPVTHSVSPSPTASSSS